MEWTLALLVVLRSRLSTVWLSQMCHMIILSACMFVFATKDTPSFSVTWGFSWVLQLAGDQMQYVGFYFKTHDPSVLLRTSRKPGPEISQRRQPSSFPGCPGSTSSSCSRWCVCCRAAIIVIVVETSQNAVDMQDCQSRYTKSRAWKSFYSFS